MTDVAIALDWWEDGSEGAISAWLVDDGDRVEAGVIVAEVMNEKVSFELFAPTSGIISIFVPAETPVVPGQVVARIAP